MKKILGYFFAGTALYFSFAGLGYANTTVSAEVQYIFNTILFLSKFNLLIIIERRVLLFISISVLSTLFILDDLPPAKSTQPIILKSLKMENF